MTNAAKASLVALAMALAGAAHAQTANPFPPPGAQAQAQVRDPLTPSAVPAGASPAPTSGRAINPAVAHPLNLEQKAWEKPDANKSARQIRPGFVRLQWRPDEIQQINVREGLLTTIKFPEQEEIVSNIVSDPGSFETLVAPNRHSVALRSLYAGVDGNIVIYGKSGNVYNFYIRSRPFNDPKLPDTTVQISVGGMASATGETMASDAPESPSYDGYKTLMTPSSTLASAAFKAGSREFARTTPPNGLNMANNIEIKVRGADDQAIAPTRAWHDDHFTYLDFGPRASSMTTWPVASLVVQGVESPIGTRVTGRDRSMMVVEGLGDIVLRNGQLMVCLKTIAPNRDPRYSIPPRINDDPRPAELKERTEIVHVAAPAAPPSPLPAKTTKKGAKTAEPTGPLAAAEPPPAPPVKASPPGKYRVLYAPMTSETETLLWTAFSDRHPAVANKTQPAWLSENGDQLQQAPTGDAKAMIIVKNLTKPEADALCPARTKTMPDIPRCKIKTGR